MTNSADQDQTAPIGAVSSGSILFASILKFVSNVRQLFAADDLIYLINLSKRHHEEHFCKIILKLDQAERSFKDISYL